MASTVTGRGGAPGQEAGQAASSQFSGQQGGDSGKFSAQSDSTSSPVPSSVGNTVGQPTVFNNLGKQTQHNNWVSGDHKKNILADTLFNHYYFALNCSQLAQ